MKFTKDEIRQGMTLYAVTDRSWLGERTLAQVVEEVLKGGATFLQLREKELDQATILAEAREIQAIAARYHVPFVINDSVDIALACDADGVHVGPYGPSSVRTRFWVSPPTPWSWRWRPSGPGPTTSALERCLVPPPSRTLRI